MRWCRAWNSLDGAPSIMPLGCPVELRRRWEPEHAARTHLVGPPHDPARSWLIPPSDCPASFPRSVVPATFSWLTRCGHCPPSCGARGEPVWSDGPWRNRSPPKTRGCPLIARRLLYFGQHTTPPPLGMLDVLSRRFSTVKKSEMHAFWRLFGIWIQAPERSCPDAPRRDHGRALGFVRRPLPALSRKQAALHHHRTMVNAGLQIVQTAHPGASDRSRPALSRRPFTPSTAGTKMTCFRKLGNDSK